MRKEERNRKTRERGKKRNSRIVRDKMGERERKITRGKGRKDIITKD